MPHTRTIDLTKKQTAGQIESEDKRLFLRPDANPIRGWLAALVFISLTVLGGIYIEHLYRQNVEIDMMAKFAAMKCKQVGAKLRSYAVFPGRVIIECRGK